MDSLLSSKYKRFRNSGLKVAFVMPLWSYFLNTLYCCYATFAWRRVSNDLVVKHEQIFAIRAEFEPYER
jgi:hypothetical protein